MTPLELSAGSAGLGVLSHLLFFIRGEHHLIGPRLLQLFFAAPVLVFAVLLRLSPWGYLGAAEAAAAVVASYLFGLYSSMFLYRAFFHRLRRFPGPFMARVSKFYHVSRVVRLDNFRMLDKLQAYGNFVRTGPSEICIYNVPEAMPSIYGPASKCTKAPRYDVTWPTVSMHSTRDRALHDKRRRIWDRAFNTKALRNYESRVIFYANQMVQQISAFSGKAVLANEWLNFFAFDVMGDLAFGRSFDMLRDGKQHYILKNMYNGQKQLGWLGPVPWLFIIMIRLPGLGSGFRSLVRWCMDQTDKRKQMVIDEPDVMSHLLEASEKAEDPAEDRRWLMGDSRLIVLAGSDTTASTLTHIFYHLAKDETQVQKLRAELERLKVTSENFNVESVRTADHLNGVINEAMRLHHPVPGGMTRVTPPDGLTLAGTYIPGVTTVIVPMYSMGRSEAVFERPEEFIPERWYSQPDLVKHKDGFAPFLIGPYSCVGKQLALMSMRTATALLVLNFDVHFAPGEDGSALINESKDVFTIAMADMRLVFEKRM